MCKYKCTGSLANNSCKFVIFITITFMHSTTSSIWIQRCLYVCRGGGGGGIFSVSSFLSLSAPLLSRSLPHSSLALCPTPLSRALVLCIPTEVIFLISTNPAHTTSLFWVFTTHRVSYCLCNTVITFPETDFIFGRYSSLHTPCICVPWVPSRAPCYSDAYPEQSGAKRQSRWTAMINVDL